MIEYIRGDMNDWYEWFERCRRCDDRCCVDLLSRGDRSFVHVVPSHSNSRHRRL